MSLNDVVLFHKAEWKKLKPGDVIFDLSNLDDVQHVVSTGKKLVKLEDLVTATVRWTGKTKYYSKNYYFLEK